MKASQLPDAARHTPVLRALLTAEQHGTSFTSANQLALCQLNQMRMLRTQTSTAQLTALPGVFGLARKTPQTLERVANASIVL
jgi:hypothetical protein